MSSSAFSSVSRASSPHDALPRGLAALRGASYEAAKRAIDIVGALAALILAGPLLLAIAAGVKLTSPGPVFFRQKRLGRGGRVFWCYKFRTMVADAEARLAQSKELRAKFDASFKIKDDPRITPFGAILRKTSLDEFPQLWNVLLGDMSLIGPRPIVPPELSKYGGFGERLLLVKPGLGGIWQVSGRSDTTYDDRIAMDMDYVDSRSLWLDVKLMALTALVVVRGRGAY